MQNPNATADHISKVLDTGEDYAKITALSHPKVTAQHLIKGLYDENLSVAYKAATHPRLPIKVARKEMQDHPVPTIRGHLLKHKEMEVEDLDKAQDDASSEVRLSVLHHPKVQPQHVERALHDPMTQVFAARHHLAKGHILDTALDVDKMPSSVRASAASNVNLTPEQKAKARNDPDWRVRYDSYMNKNTKPEELYQAFNNREPGVLKQFIIEKHPGIDEGHLKHVVHNEPDDYTVAAAIEHPKITKELLRHASKHPNPYVTAIARRRLREWQ
jgi:hypothetical protein